MCEDGFILNEDAIEAVDALQKLNEDEQDKILDEAIRIARNEDR